MIAQPITVLPAPVGATRKDLSKAGGDGVMEFGADIALIGAKVHGSWEFHPLAMNVALTSGGRQPWRDFLVQRIAV